MAGVGEAHVANGVSATRSTDALPRLLSSFTRKKELVKSIEPHRLRWYICGPTVYAPSHLGHARNYVNFDILRRVYTQHFGYNVTYVMNVTDIDDKIILKTHTERISELVDAVRSALNGAPRSEADTDTRKKADAAVAEGERVLGERNAKMDALLAAQKGLREALSLLLSATTADGDDARRRLAERLDVQTEFLRLARRYENEFHRDMRLLGVREADALTRVSEYMPKVVEFVERIIERGFAYVAGGGDDDGASGARSVYFDVDAFAAADGKHYGKLVPAAVKNAELLAEGEGALTDSGEQKRSRSDFVLWKRSKQGEPHWPSPWGDGRPGWHVECSAMCSDVLGPAVDVNCGGVDLAFPHHENQLAQSEAYWDCGQWVRYFLHSGHLHIDGLKMSKSLKNFVTISAALELYTARQLRFLFLLHQWSEPMELTLRLQEDGGEERGVRGFVQMDHAVGIDAAFSEFFHTIKGQLRTAVAHPERETSWGDLEKRLDRALRGAQNDIHEALCDSVDTPKVLRLLMELVREVNVYISAAGAQSGAARAQLLASVARYIGGTLRMFGVGGGGEELGFDDAGGGAAGESAEKILTPHLNVWSQFRDDVRRLAREKLSDEGAGAALLRLCDELRDEKLPGVGVRIDDGGGGDGGGLWKLYSSASELRRLMEKEREEAKEREEQKRRRQDEQRRKDEERDRRASVPPERLFADVEEYRGQFGSFGDDGVPLTDAAGDALTKSARKKLDKARSLHVKAHSAWKQRKQADAGSGES